MTLRGLRCQMFLNYYRYCCVLEHLATILAVLNKRWKIFNNYLQKWLVFYFYSKKKNHSISHFYSRLLWTFLWYLWANRTLKVIKNTSYQVIKSFEKVHSGCPGSDIHFQTPNRRKLTIIILITPPKTAMPFARLKFMRAVRHLLATQKKTNNLPSKTPETRKVSPISHRKFSPVPS